jgi:hypothetical protein
MITIGPYWSHIDAIVRVKLAFHVPGAFRAILGKIIIAFNEIPFIPAAFAFIWVYRHIIP